MKDKINITNQRIKELIEKSGKTRQEIAKDLKCDTSTITKHYNGDRDITTDFVIKYSKYFNVSADYLLGLPTMKLTDERAFHFVCDYTGLSQDNITHLSELKNNYDKYKGNVDKDYNEWLNESTVPMEYDLNVAKQSKIYLDIIDFLISENLNYGDRLYVSESHSESGNTLFRLIYGYYNNYYYRLNDKGTVTSYFGGATNIKNSEITDYITLKKIEEYIEKSRKKFVEKYPEDVSLPKYIDDNKDDVLPF